MNQAELKKTTAEEKEFDLAQMEKETEEMLNLRYINEKNAEFAKTKGGFVSLRIEGEWYPRVVFYRAFPFSDPEYFISVRQPDEKAKEIGVIHRLDLDFPKEIQDIIHEQMNMRYFTPRITKIINIKEEYGYAYFDVLTDHGACRFTSVAGGNSVINLSDTRILITDLDGNRFEVADITQLSAAELKKLDIFL